MLKLLTVTEKLWDEAWERQITCENPGIAWVETACNGLTALERISKLKPDILIVDTDLKDISGLIVAKNAVRKVPDIKIIFISGFKDYKFAKEALRLKACAYLLKPVDCMELSVAVGRAVCQRLEEMVFEEEKARLSRFMYAGCL